MALLVTDPDLEHRLIAERQRCEGDRFDEVWEGLYVMAPLANNEHQELQSKFVAVITDAFGWDPSVKVLPGANVSDRNEGWEHNYRCPDVLVFLPGNRAIDRDTHWEGGPDFLVEVASDRDRSRDKLPFYAQVGVREVLIVDRHPWKLELYASEGSSAAMRLVGVVTPDGKTDLPSGVLPLVFQLHAGTNRPRIHARLTSPANADPARGRVSWII